MKDIKLSIGIDFGSDSVRCLLVNVLNGEEINSTEAKYSRWSKGLYCDAANNQFRQHPLDYLEGMESALDDLLSPLSDKDRRAIFAIGVDTTGSTPIAVNSEGLPLSLTEEFSENPDAMFFLWKDHTSKREAEIITKLSRTWGGVDYTKYCGGIYSPEWFWSKLMYLVGKSPAIINETSSWVEHCDWMTGVLVGDTSPCNLKRSQCAAGHKAMWHEEWSGLPCDEFLSLLSPELTRIKETFAVNTYTSDQVAGNLSKEWADKWGLSSEVVVSVGLLDAHAGAVGGGIQSGTLLKVIGTSTCDMAVVSKDNLDFAIPGIGGQVSGSIIPNMIGLEAGQSAFGDIYAWFKSLLMWPIENLKDKGLIQDSYKLSSFIEDSLIVHLSEEAEKINASELVSVDWWNGRRSPYVDMTLKGSMTGFNLGTSAPAMFKSLVESTVFGSKLILEHLRENSVELNEVIAIGGVAKKSSFVMQTMADAFNMPVHVLKSDQVCALGTVVLASVAAKVFPDVTCAQEVLASKIETTYTPNIDNVAVLKINYQRYLTLAASNEQANKKVY